MDLALADVSRVLPAQTLRMRLAHQRLTRRYDRLLMLSRWLLPLLGSDVSGGDEEGLGLTFDMNQLFQATVGKPLMAAMRRHPQRDRLRLTRERPSRALVEDADGRGRCMTYSDLCIQLDAEIVAILRYQVEAA